MHKNFRNTNQARSIVQLIIDDKLSKLLEKTAAQNLIQNDLSLPIIERKNVKDLMQKRVKSVGNFIPIRENKIMQRLLSFIKKNRVALRYEQACCRHIKQFSATAFLVCEICETIHTSIDWSFCKNCGAFNNYQI